MLVTEKQLQGLVIEAALIAGWLAFHAYDSRRSQPGFPDLVLVRGSEALFVELKSAHGRLSVDQREWIEALAGVEHVEAMVVRPDGADDLVERLTRKRVLGSPP